MPKNKDNISTMKSRLVSSNLLAITGIALSLVSLITLALVATMGYQNLNDKIMLNGSVNVREATIKAIEGLQQTAPRDFKTGYTYFPERHLYLPIAVPESSFTYNLRTYIGKDSESNKDSMWVSTENQIENSTANLAEANNDMKTMFDNLPKAQQCSRGVLVSLKPEKIKGLRLAYKVDAGNGKTVYLYSQNICPETKPLVTELKAIKAY